LANLKSCPAASSLLRTALKSIVGVGVGIGEGVAVGLGVGVAGGWLTKGIKMGYAGIEIAVGVPGNLGVRDGVAEDFIG